MNRKKAREAASTGGFVSVCHGREINGGLHGMAFVGPLFHWLRVSFCRKCKAG